MHRYLYAAMALTLAVAWSSDGFAIEKIKINKNQVVPGQTMTGASKLINKGTITGGAQPGIVSTTPGPKTIINTGTISGSTGIKITGASGGGVVIVNRGTISSGP